MMVVKLPFPSASLFPNRKNGQHWGKTVAERTAQHEAGYLLTKQAKGDYTPPDGPIALSLLYLTPDKRKRDADNMLAASKALIDGMAYALGIDDSRFRPVLVDWQHGPKGGALIAAVGVQIISGANLVSEG
jgi:crossover junction endodeoxyribonuclease RusA